jgi:hypothetical protein
MDAATLADLLLKAGSVHADRPAVVTPAGRDLTYGGLRDKRCGWPQLVQALQTFVGLALGRPRMT